MTALKKLLSQGRRITSRGIGAIAHAGVKVLKREQPTDGFKAGGWFTTKCYDKFGNLKWAERAHNVWTRAGRSFLMSCLFNTSTGQKTLSVGMYVTSDTSPASTWDMTSQGITWTEFTNYTASANQQVRPQYLGSGAVALASSRLNNTANKAIFSINAASTIYGAFLVTTATSKADTDGILIAMDAFGTERSVASSDEVQVTYTFAASDDAA